MARYHFGTIGKLRSGRYPARYMFHGVMFRAPETFREVSDARAWLEEGEKKRRRGTWVDPHRITLADYAPKWVRGRRLGENALGENAFGKYNYLVRAASSQSWATQSWVA